MNRMTKLLSPLLVAVLATVPLLPKVVRAGTTSDHSAGQLVNVRVLVDNHVAPLYARGWGLNSARSYFEAFQGGHYAVELRNRTNRRIGVLISVDGLNVVSGVRSSLTPEEGMYVLGPFESATIRGWRTSLDDIRQFVFVDEQRSYAQRTGQANGDMGWLRVLAFEEQHPWGGWGREKSNYRGGGEPSPAPSSEDRADQDRGAPAPSASGKAQAAPETQGLARDEATRESAPGTGWGERREDHVERTVFLAEHTATDQLVFRYEYASGLRALGIFPRQPRVWERDRGQLGFAQPPRW